MPTLATVTRGRARTAQRLALTHDLIGVEVLTGLTLALGGSGPHEHAGEAFLFKHGSDVCHHLLGDRWHLDVVFLWPLRDQLLVLDQTELSQVSVDEVLRVRDDIVSDDVVDPAGVLRPHLAIRAEHDVLDTRRVDTQLANASALDDGDEGVVFAGDEGVDLAGDHFLGEAAELDDHLNATVEEVGGGLDVFGVDTHCEVSLLCSESLRLDYL